MTQEEFFKRYFYTPSHDRIGGGGFGTVYKAKDNLLHRTVAIKVSEVKTTADGKKTFSLKDEFEALNHVPKHPNIANYEELYSFEDHRGLCDYAVMQYYPGGNLSNAIKQGLTIGQKDDIATQLLEGIAFLHQHKVVHRDLKPSNILIVKDGDKVIPLITDFGLSKAADVVDGSVFTNSFGAGTPRYSSPEQLQGDDLRLNTDLWSYGVVLYELFTGEQLFSASSGAASTAQADMEVYNKIVNGNVQSLGKMTEKWRKVAERCLVVDSAKRAKDAGELFAIIKGDEDETEVPEDKPTPKDPHNGTPPSKGAGGIKDSLSPTPNDKPKNKKNLWIGLGIAVAAVVALLVLLLKPKPEPTSTDPDTQAYEACQTVNDFRAYIHQYGQDAKHFGEAQAFVEQWVADSLSKVEDKAYMKCTTIEDCNAYLEAYPEGRYVEDVKTMKAELEAKATTGTANGHEWVDLGLPSGTLWATCNVGATKSEEYGDHFAWGETYPKRVYDKENYKYFDGEEYTKYTGKDNLNVLQPEDDAARANWGVGWRMPTKEEWKELLNNTTNRWTEQNGVKGRLFTADNGNSLFLPAAGGRLDDRISSIGYIGYYWSSSLFSNTNSVFHSLFFPDHISTMGIDRSYGYSVRPVRERYPLSLRAKTGVNNN